MLLLMGQFSKMFNTLSATKYFDKPSVAKRW